MSVITSGRVMAPRSVARSPIPVADPDFGRRWPPTAARPAARGARQMGSPSCNRPASNSIRQVDSTASPGPGAAGRAAPHRARRAGRRPTARAGEFLAGSRGTGRPRSMPSSSARICSTRASEVALVGSAASNGRIRPSQSTNAPDFSTTGATGKTTSASSVTALSRSSRLTTNGAASIAANAAAGSGRSAGSTPPISSAPSSPVRAAARMPACRGPVAAAGR